MQTHDPAKYADIDPADFLTPAIVRNCLSVKCGERYVNEKKGESLDSFEKYYIPFNTAGHILPNDLFVKMRIEAKLLFYYR